ncbi:MAG: HAD-IA family hydrolase [Ruthenibacterium sp.]
MYKNIVVDLGGVVVDYAPREFLVDHFLNEKLENKLYDITFGSNEWLMMDAGELTREEGNAIMREKGLALGCKYEVDIILTDWFDMLCTRDDTVQLLKRLRKRGYSVFYLSNISSDVLEILQQRNFWKLFNGGIASCEVKLNKPDPRIFTALLQKYNLNANECLFIDDNKTNATAAHEANITGIHFRNIRLLARTLVGYGVHIEKKSAPISAASATPPAAVPVVPATPAPNTPSAAPETQSPK